MERNNNMPKNSYKSKNSNKLRKSRHVQVSNEFYETNNGEVFGKVNVLNGKHVKCVLLISDTGKHMQDGREIIASIERIFNKAGKRVGTGSIVKLEQTKKNPKEKDWMVVDVHPHKKKDKTLKILGLREHNEDYSNDDDLGIVFIRSEDNKDGYKNNEAFSIDDI